MGGDQLCHGKRRWDRQTQIICATIRCLVTHHLELCNPLRLFTTTKVMGWSKGSYPPVNNIVQKGFGNPKRIGAWCTSDLVGQCLLLSRHIASWRMPRWCAMFVLKKKKKKKKRGVGLGHKNGNSIWRDIYWCQWHIVHVTSMMTNAESWGLSVWYSMMDGDVVTYSKWSLSLELGRISVFVTEREFFLPFCGIGSLTPTFRTADKSDWSAKPVASVRRSVIGNNGTPHVRWHVTIENMLTTKTHRSSPIIEPSSSKETYFYISRRPLASSRRKSGCASSRALHVVM